MIESWGANAKFVTERVDTSFERRARSLQDNFDIVRELNSQEAKMCECEGKELCDACKETIRPDGYVYLDPTKEGQQEDKDAAIVDRINNNFSYHPPKEDQPRRYELLRSGAKILATLIEQHCPDSREKSLALTNLEQAVMWANASIARNE